MAAPRLGVDLRVATPKVKTLAGFVDESPNAQFTFSRYNLSNNLINAIGHNVIINVNMNLNGLYCLHLLFSLSAKWIHLFELIQ